MREWWLSQLRLGNFPFPPTNFTPTATSYATIFTFLFMDTQTHSGGLTAAE